MIPKRRKPAKMNVREPDRIRCPGHLQYVRGFGCSVPRCENRDIEAAHVRVGTDGGTGIKPSDRYVIPLCRTHHEFQHRGERSFAIKYGIDALAIAGSLWNTSPHGVKWRREHGEGR